MIVGRDMLPYSMYIKIIDIFNRQILNFMNRQILNEGNSGKAEGLGENSFSRLLYRSLRGIVKFLSLAIILCFMPFYLQAQQTTINVGGQSRSLFVYAPASLGQNRPLVISLHGLNQDINYQKNQAKWELVADTAKFVVVYPAGVNNSWDISGNRDIDFILAIIDNMATRFSIDRNRVYVSGFSMGGMMSYHTANKIADKVAAIGPVSGYLFGNVTASSRPMPIIHVHGNADDVVYYGARGNQQGVVAMLQKWRSWNKCPATGTRTSPYPVNRPNSKSVMEYWGPCDNSAVELITLDGKGHWHSNDDAGVHTTKELWSFLKRYSLGSGGLPVVSITAPSNNSSYTTPASISIAANASDSNGSIAKVEFYSGSTKLGEDATAPYAFVWNNVAEGSYSITAVATDNTGNKTTSETVAIKVNLPQGPYNGNPHVIPSRIEAEHYDVGGEGVAFHEANSNGNEGGASLRNDEVDIETTGDVSGVHNIGYILQGEWLEYTVQVDQAGDYKLDLRMAADGAGKTLHVEVDGVNVTGTVQVPNTGAWQVWSTVNAGTIALSAGNHVVRLAFDASYMNLNYLEFTKSPITGLDNEALAIMNVYPNPFKESIHIDLTTPYSYQLMNSLGRVVEEGTGAKASEIGASLPEGVYTLKIIHKDKTSLVRLVKAS